MANQHRNVLTATDGFTLAVDMAREIREISKRALPEQPCAIEQAYRAPGTPQRNVVEEYLQRIDATGTPEVRRGLTAFLTEYLESCLGGVVPDLEIYEEIAESETI